MASFIVWLSITISDISETEFQLGDVIGYYQPSDSIWNIQTDEYTSYTTDGVNNSITAINISDLAETNRQQPLIQVLFDIQCDNLSTPSKGQITSCSSGRVGVGYEGDTCNFTCNNGYELTGSDARTCQRDGSWSGNNGTCNPEVVIICPELNDIPNGDLKCLIEGTHKYFVGDNCTYICDPGYELIGSDTRTCQSNGSWSGSDDMCRRATGEDSSSTFSTEIVAGAAIVFVLLLIIIFCAMGCCVIWVRRKKTYPISSVYYSNVKSINNLEGHGETFVQEESSRLTAVYCTIRANATYENPKDYTVSDYLKPHDYVTMEEALISTEGVYESPVQLDAAMEDEQMIYDTPCDDDEDYGPIYTEPPNDLEKIYEITDGKRLRKLFHWNIKTIKSLGSGEFGVVTKGVLSSIDGASEVAIKALNTNAKDRDKLRFLQEAAIMCQFDHENVIKLYGVVTDVPEMIVLEYMSRGDLRNFLHILRPPSYDGTVHPKLPLLLLKFCQEIAAGMAYLSGKQFVHRDLAARNVLISEKYICKIADFGMSRDLLDDNYYITSGGKIPVKWTAPEATHYKKYSIQSDVWSFGCVLYEIWSLGYKPFDEISNIEVMEKLDRGHRLPPPPGCSRTIYRVMIKCWHPDPRSRPQFGQITKLLAGNGNYLLGWSDEDKQVAGEDGMKLGAPLECAKNSYYDLQTIYNQNVSL
ncbi:uncharacterized protein [Dysidea avara]|uniref:uncharacterized protein isoform X2 n=1 Tax=Dysidea avara TaxID=196820 RepID=UPI00332D1512